MPSDSSPSSYCKPPRKTQPDILECILKKRRDIQRAQVSLFWATVNFFIVIAVCFEMSFGSILWSLQFIHPLTWYSAPLVAAICIVNFLINCWRYISVRLLSPNIELTIAQQKLFGVSDYEPGFRILSQLPVSGTLPSGPQFSASAFSNLPERCSPSSSPWQPCYRKSALSSNGSSPLFSPHDGSLSRMSGSYSLNTSSCPGRSPLSMTGPNSLSNFSTDGNLSFIGPLNFTSASAGLPGSPHNLLGTGQRESLGAQAKSHSPKMSPLRSEDCIRDQNALHQYLQEQEQKQMLKPSAEIPQAGSHVNSSSFWSYGRTALDALSVLRHYQYQLAPRSPLSSTCKDDPLIENDSPSTEEMNATWSRFGVDPDHVDRWVENLRKWIGRTILSRLVCEIDEVNKMLTHIGSDDVQIGEASLMTLKQVATVKAQHVPQLSAVLPYIDFVPNQEYLISRIRELANGGCIGEFKWNGGAEFKRKVWDETLPTDSAILIHLLCAYMDARLPCHPKYPDGKTFTSQHFVKIPDKPNLCDRKDNLAIYQTRVNPPHFKVVIESSVWNVKPGRHNLFHAILLFLYHIKTKEHGMLRRINLGMSGINILWIFDQ